MLRLRKRLQTGAGSGLEGCGISPQLAHMLALRGVTTAEEARRFLAPSAEDLHDPFKLYGMEDAVRIIRGAMAANEPIVIYGDYDVDGVCAASILVEALRAHGAQVSYRIPSRHKDGYGLNCDAVRELSQDFRLMITVDCGITSVKEAALAREMNLKLVITDHHEPPQLLPQADAVVDPLLGDAPFKSLCGAGVAFKLACALFGLEAAEPLMELAALATVADLVPLLDENRVIVALGLRQMQRTQRLGLRELIAVSGLQGKTVTAGHLGFQLGPRLNAGGRLGDSNRCVQLLTTRDPYEAARIAHELDETNAERQRIEAAIIREAEKQVAAQADFLQDKVLIAVGEGWNRGVVGLAAGRLTEKYAWPSIVFTEEDGMLTGSARSVAGVNIHAALSRCEDLYERFGGHAMAAGLTMKREHLEEFRERLNAAAAEIAEEDAYVPGVTYDFDVTLSEITTELVDDFAKLSPTGLGNPAPVLAVRGVHVLEARAVGSDGRHLKLRFEQDGASVGGIAFGMGAERAAMPETVDVVFSPVANEWMGRRSAECEVKRIVPHEGAAAFAAQCRAREEAFSLALLDAQLPQEEPLPEKVMRAQLRDALTASCQGTLFTVKTLSGALRWVNFLTEAGLSDRIDCCFSRPSDVRRFNSLCAMPAENAGEGFERVIALDDEDVRAEIRAMMPTDERLRGLYRTLRGWPGPMRSERALAEAAGMPLAAVRLGLRAFDELGLVMLTREPFEAVMLPMRKCSLSDSPTLKRLRHACRWEEEV